MFFCQNCNRKFDNWYAREAHIRASKKRGSCLPKKKKNKPRKKRGNTNKKVQKNECPHCKRKFDSRPAALNHISTYNRTGRCQESGDSDVYTCEICGEEFENRTTLGLHRKTHKKRAKPPVETITPEDVDHWT